MEDKKYDFVLLNLANPTFNGSDFKIVGDMTVDNTLFMPFEYYSNSERILTDPRFQDSNGEYNEDAFRNYYYQTTSKYADFIDSSSIDDLEYNYYDVSRPPGAKVHDQQFRFIAQSNPNHITVGLAGPNEVARSDLSIRELAQRSNVVNSQTGEEMNYSVNDISLIGNIGGYIRSLFTLDPIVYAVYDEDTLTRDPYTGRIIMHQKGEYKLNDDGEYYTETLGGRSMLGREAVSMWDYITVDGEGANKYDFFDGDSLTKSTAGTIMRSVTAAIPIFLPGIGPLYGTILLTKSMAEIIPMLVGVSAGLLGAENVEFPAMNTLSAMGKRLTLSQSDYDRGKIFAWNNIINMAGDLATFFGAQNTMVKGISALRGNPLKVMDVAYSRALNTYQQEVNKAFAAMRADLISALTLIRETGGGTINDISKRIVSGTWQKTPLGSASLRKYLPAAENAVARWQKYGENASLYYFAMILNTDFYDELRLRGINEREAALMTLGSMIGVFSVDKYLKLGTIFFLQPELEMALKAVGRAEAENATKAVLKDGIHKGAETASRKQMAGMLGKGVQSGKNIVERFWQGLSDRNLPLFGKTVGEGLMRVSEEGVHDLTRALANLAGEFGVFSETDYGAFEDPVDRYAMTFLGGAFGGLLFGTLDKIKTGKKKAEDKIHRDQVYMIRNGRKEELLKIYKDMYDRGLLGSKHLTSKLSEKDANGNLHYLPVTEGTKSQADEIYELLVETTNILDAALNRNGMALSEALTLDKMLLGEYLAKSLSLFLRNDKEGVKSASFATFYYQEMLALAEAIGEAEIDLAKLKSLLDSAKHGPDYERALKEIEDRLGQLRDIRDYLFGKGSLGFVEALLFLLDGNLSNAFMVNNFDTFVYSITGKEVDELSPVDLANLRKLFDSHTDNKKYALYEVFKEYKRVGRYLLPEIDNLGDVVAEIARQKSVSETDPLKLRKQWDDRLDSESDDEYTYRNLKMENESEELFKARLEKRKKAIYDYNNANIMKWLDDMSKQQLTKTEQRRLRLLLNDQEANMLDEIFNRSLMAHPENALTPGIMAQILDVLRARGVNIESDEALKLIHNILFTAIRESVAKDRISPSDFENEGWAGVFESLGDSAPTTENGKSMTKGDIYSLFLSQSEHIAREEGETNRAYAERVILELSDGWATFELPGEGMPDTIATRLWQAADFIARVLDQPTPEAREAMLKSEEAADIIIYGNKDINEETITKMRPAELIVLQLLNEINALIENTSALQVIRRLRHDAYVQSPIIGILSKMVGTIEGSKVNVEEFLSNLYDSYMSNADHSEFQLSDEQIGTIKQFINDLLILRVYILAAREPVNERDQIIGHNYAINDYIENHRDAYPDAELLPTVSNDGAAFLIYELDSYMEEMYEWLSLSHQNSESLRLRFQLSTVALRKTNKAYWKNIMPALKKLENKTSIKFTDGLDALLNSELLTLSLIQKIEQQIHDNFRKVYDKTPEEQKDKLLDDIFTTLMADGANEGSGLIIKDISNVIRSDRADLDETLTYDTLTDYDRMALFVTSLIVDNKEFYSHVRDFFKEEKKIPLEILIHIARQMAATKTSDGRRIVNKFLLTARALAEGKPGGDIAVLWNTSRVPGITGGGKTSVIVGLNISKTDKVWVSAPGENQRGRLKNSVEGKAGSVTEKSIDELIGYITGVDDEQKVLKGDKNEKQKGSVYKRADNKGLDGNPTVAMEESFTKRINESKWPNSIEKPTKIIIDEATWITLMTQCALSDFVGHHDIELVVVGDNFLNGISVDNGLRNMLTEESFTWTAPRINISIRAANTLKANNTRWLNGVLTLLHKLTTTEDMARNFNIMRQRALLDNKLQYFDSAETFYGDMIVNDIDDVFINKLKSLYDQKKEQIDKDQFIAYVGPQGELYNRLKNIFQNDLKYFDTADAILGDEFDYVIIDKQWATDFVNNTPNTPDGQLQYILNLTDFISDVYTMTSRAIEGSIIIDHNNISDIIRLERNNSTGRVGDRKKIAELIGLSFERELSELFPTSETDKSPVKDATSHSNASTVGSKNAPNQNMTRLPSAGRPQNEQPVVPTKGDGIPFDMPNVPGSPKGQYESETGNTIEFSKTNLQSTLDAIMDRFAAVQNVISPYRAYGQFMFSGCRMERVDLGNDEHGYIWHKNDASSPYYNTDMDIFMTEGQVVATNDTLTKGRISNLLKELNDYLLYSTEKDNYYNELDDQCKMFTREELDNVKYILRSREASEHNMLVGLTDADNNKRTIGQNKVVTLVAEITHTNANGQIEHYYVTLAALANPVTWNRNAADAKYNLELLILRMRDNGASAEAISEKEEFLNNYDTLRDVYEKFINDFTAIELDMVLDTKPVFNTMTAFRSVRTAPKRLMNTNNDARPFDHASGGGIRSHVFGISNVGMARELGISENCVGSPAIFVTQNTLLPKRGTGTLLEILYEQYKKQRQAMRNGEEVSLGVRLIILDAVGLPFHALFDKRLEEINAIRKQGEQRDGSYILVGANQHHTIPMHMGTVGVRMFVSMWNWRASLKNFLDRYQVWRDAEGLTDEAVSSICELERQVFDNVHKLLGHTRDQKTGRWVEHLSEEELLRFVRDPNRRKEIDDDVVSKLELLWGFNNGDEYGALIRFFRLGHSEDYNGAYIRRLVNTHGNDFYDLYRTKVVNGETVENTINGIFINPELAYTYNNVLDALFKLVVEQFIDIPQVQISDTGEYEALSDRTYLDADNLLVYISEDDRTEGGKNGRPPKGWFSSMLTGAELIVPIHDDSGKSVGTMRVNSPNSFSSMATMMIYTAKNIDLRTKNLTPSVKELTFTKEGQTTSTTIDLLPIFDALKCEHNGEDYTLLPFAKESTNVTYDVAGFTPYKYGADGAPMGSIDRRISNLFNLMFHGLTSTAEINTFGHGEIHADGVVFPYGFFASAIYVAKTGTDREIIPVATNERFFQSDVVPTAPIIGLSIDMIDLFYGRPRRLEPKAPEVFHNAMAKDDILSRYGINLSALNLKGKAPEVVAAEVTKYFLDRIYDLITTGKWYDDLLPFELRWDGKEFKPLRLTDVLEERAGIGEVGNIDIERTEDGQGLICDVYSKDGTMQKRYIVSYNDGILIDEVLPKRITEEAARNEEPITNSDQLDTPQHLLFDRLSIHNDIADVLKRFDVNGDEITDLLNKFVKGQGLVDTNDVQELINDIINAIPGDYFDSRIDEETNTFYNPITKLREEVDDISEYLFVALGDELDALLNKPC